MSSDNNIALRVDHMSKRYRMVAGRESVRSIVSQIGQRLRHGAQSAEQDYFWALSDINFAVEGGEALGIVGPNGAGKTTILKLLSKVTRPTQGGVTINGRFSSLIELGAGFHPDLSGRENVYLNGTILGLTTQQIKARFDEIVAFAGLERFIDMPVKRYSSGMYARLGFSVAAHVDPEIMLVDEVLAVGDASFQRKCYDFIHEFVTSGKTTVFVSHNLFVVEQLCTRVIWLEGGRQMMEGTPSEVLPAYLDSMDRKVLADQTIKHTSEGQLNILEISFTDAEGRPRESYVTGEDVVVNLRYRADDYIKAPGFCVTVMDSQGGKPLFMASMLVDGQTQDLLPGEGVLSCRFKGVPLLPRAYHVWGEVWAADRARLLVMWQRFGAFIVESSSELQKQALGRGSIRHLRADAPIRVPYDWQYRCE
jgi:lipopolysaccharide transport system ATP-binding protein